jgi:hypothetical protein
MFKNEKKRVEEAKHAIYAIVVVYAKREMLHAHGSMLCDVSLGSESREAQPVSW